MKLIDNLNAINDCKEAIKEALVRKGVDMTTATFSDYATKIDELQFEPGDTPDPTPSADYIYSNGYLTNGTDVNDIVTFIPYEIALDGENKFVIELTCPEEIPSYEGSSYCDVIFTVDIPATYDIINFEFFEGSSNAYIPQAYKENPRHSTTVRNGVTYKSYVRKVEDDIDYGSEYIAFEPLQYRITIEKK
jgi:hypothetical protein